MRTKYEELARVLRMEIGAGRYGAQRRLPSESALTARFAVSRQTVRRALELLEQDGLLARRHGSGSYLTDAVPLSRRAALLVPDSDDLTFAALSRRLSEALARRGIETATLLTQDTTEGERACLQTLLRGGFCGAAVCGVHTALPTVNLDLYQALGAQGLPLIFLWERPRELTRFPCACLDMEGAGEQLIGYLSGLGHKKIGGLFRGDSLAGQAMFSGAYRALMQRALELPDRRVLWYDAQDIRALRTGSSALAEKLKTRMRDCTALVCQNDEIALWAVRLLARSGVRVPEDISVAACGGRIYSDLSGVPLTALQAAEPGLGAAAAKLLLSALDGKAARDVTLGWRLVPRASTGIPGQ